MTAPAPQEQLDTGQTAEIAALLAGMLAAGAAVAGTAAGTQALLASYEASRIVTVLAGLGVDRDVATVVLSMTLQRSPLPSTARVAPDHARARRANQTVNLTRRAAYLVNAAKRMQAALAQPALPPNVVPFPGAEVPGTDRRTRLREALQRERVYWRQHVAAQQQRNRNAKSIDDLAAIHGDRLTWVTIHDARTSRYCAKASGRQFYVSQRPPLGFPGDVHPDCRCKPGPPNGRTQRWIYDLLPIDEH